MGLDVKKKKRLPVTFLKSFLPPSLSTAILMGIFLVPHGIGYRFSIGHVDIPRLIVLALVAFWFVGLLRCFFKSKMIILKPGTKLVGILVMLILMSAIASSNPVASAILAGQLCLLWFVFALAYVSVFVHDEDGRLLNVALIMIFVILFLYGLYEVLFQKYLVPHDYRPSFWGIAGYEWVRLESCTDPTQF